MKKLLALILCLALALIPLSSVAAFADGEGYTLDEESKTYTVTTADGLLAVNALVNNGQLDYNITLAADISLDGKEYVPLGTSSSLLYKGTFDGAGHTISNLTINTPGNNCKGLIAYSGDGVVVKNITFLNPSVTVKQYGAFCIGQAWGAHTTISGIVVDNGHLTTGTNNYIGALVGRFEKSAQFFDASNCILNVFAEATQSVAGAVGGEAFSASGKQWTGTFRNIVVTGKITCSKAGSGHADRVGGIVGYSSNADMTFENCIVFANFVAQYEWGSMNALSKEGNYSYTNCYSSSPFSGSLTASVAYSTTIANSAIYTTTDATSADFFSTAIGANSNVTVTVDGTVTSSASLQIPTIQKDALKTKIKTVYADDAAFLAKAEADIEEVIDHVHKYDQEVADPLYLKEAPSCYAGAVYYKSCTCGEMGTETFVAGDPIDHAYLDAWSANETQHWHACKYCGKELKDVADHTFGEWTTVKEATDETCSYRVRTCSVCGYEEHEGAWEQVIDTTDTVSKDKTYEVLFIGNSYTYYNDLGTLLFYNIAKSAGYTVNVDTIIKGAWTLAGFADPTDEMGAQVKAKLDAKKYDYIIIQEQSHTPVTDKDSFYAGAAKLIQMIRDNGATPILYETWGRKAGNADITTYNLEGNEPMTWRLAAAYTKAGYDNNTAIAYAGLAMYDVYTHTVIDTYQSDGSHANLRGSYLAALTIFSAIFHEPVVGNVTYIPDGVSTNDAAILMAAADNAMFHTPAIPMTYLNEYEFVQPAAHSYSVEWANNETNHWHVCEVCGSAKSDEAAHSYGEWEIVTAPTTDATGLKKHTCAVCGYEENDVIPKIEAASSEESGEEQSSEVPSGEVSSEVGTADGDDLDPDALGCKSVVGASFGLLFVVAGAAIMIGKKKEH